MGEIAEMMLDGTLCAGCGEFLDTDSGFPMYCAGCEPQFEERRAPRRFRTPEVVSQHERDRHPKPSTNGPSPAPTALALLRSARNPRGDMRRRLA